MESERCLALGCWTAEPSRSNPIAFHQPLKAFDHSRQRFKMFLKDFTMPQIACLGNFGLKEWEWTSEKAVQEKKKEPAGGWDGEMSAAPLSEQSEEEVIEQQWVLHPHFALQSEVSLTSTLAGRRQPSGKKPSTLGKNRQKKETWSTDFMWIVFVCICSNSGLNMCSVVDYYRMAIQNFIDLITICYSCFIFFSFKYLEEEMQLFLRLIE